MKLKNKTGSHLSSTNIDFIKNMIENKQTEGKTKAFRYILTKLSENSYKATIYGRYLKKWFLEKTTEFDYE